MATTFDINQFRTQLKNGGARPNQFEVQITFPPAITNLNAAYGRASSFLVTVAELPGQTMGVTPVYYRGREIKLAGDKVFAPFTCTVLNDTDFQLRDEEETITISMVKTYQPHILDIDFVNAIIRATNKKLLGQRMDSIEDFESYMNKHI